MKALQQIAYGPPAEVVKLVDVEDPQPGPDEIVVEIEAAPVHLADIKFITGDEGFRWFEMPRWPGHEGIGRVVAKGDSVSVFDIGDRVFPPLGGGTYRQKLSAPASDCIAAPEGDAAQIGLMTVNGLTALILLDDYGLKPGDWLIQNGANSSCGRFLIVLARKKGMKTVNIVRRPELAAELEELGADIVLVASDDPDEMAARVAAATDNAEIPVGIDCVASTGTVAIARCLTQGGTVVNYGFMSGENSQMAFQDMFRNQVSLVGMSMTRRRTEEERQREFDYLSEMMTEGGMKARIAARYPLDQAQEAFAHELKSGTEREGKIIIVPNG